MVLMEYSKKPVGRPSNPAQTNLCRGSLHFVDSLVSWWEGPSVGIDRLGGPSHNRLKETM